LLHYSYPSLFAPTETLTGECSTARSRSVNKNNILAVITNIKYYGEITRRGSNAKFTQTNTTGNCHGRFPHGCAVNAAAVIILEDCGNGGVNCATGITGLSAIGSIWDIDFVLGDYTNATALGNNAAAFDTAIDAALNGSVAEWIIAPASAAENSYSVLNAFIRGGPGTPPFNITTPVYVSGFKSRYACVIDSPGCTPQWHGLADSSLPTDEKYWVVATEVAPVPIPAAVWLFGSGVLGLVGMARRKAA
jgi:hypothetical protein